MGLAKLDGKTLNSLERSTLRSCEKVIEEGIPSFMSVGQALLQIKTEALYREEYSSFATYCEQRWGFTVRRAQQYIQGATLSNGVSSKSKQVKSAKSISGSNEGVSLPSLPEIPTDSHARELSKVPEEERAQVWGDVVEEHGEKPTVVQVREVVQEYLGEEEEEEELTTEEECEIHNKAIESLCRRVMAEAKVKPAAYWVDHKGRWDGYLRKLKQALDTLRSAKCVICPACEGEGCKECDKVGYLPKIDAEGIQAQ